MKGLVDVGSGRVERCAHLEHPSHMVQTNPCLFNELFPNFFPVYNIYATHELSSNHNNYVLKVKCAVYKNAILFENKRALESRERTNLSKFTPETKEEISN